MDRADVALGLIGIAPLATAPSEPSYSMSGSEAPDATPAEVPDFSGLTTESRGVFLSLLEGGNRRNSETPPL